MTKLDPSPTNRNPSRRAVIQGIAAAGFVTAAGSVSAKSQSDIGPNDRKLLDLEKRCLQAEQDYTEALNAEEAIEDAIADRTKRTMNKDYFDGRFMMFSPYSGIPVNRLGDREYFEARRKQYFEKLEEAWQAHCEEVRAENQPLFEASGLNAARREAERLQGIADGLCQEIADTRPDSAIGLAVKSPLVRRSGRTGRFYGKRPLRGHSCHGGKRCIMTGTANPAAEQIKSALQCFNEWSDFKPVELYALATIDFGSVPTPINHLPRCRLT